MVNTPNWQGAVPGQAGTAGQVNQFLGSHNSSVSYGGVLAIDSGSGSAVYNETYDQYMAQLFTTTNTQTSVDYVQLQLNAVGGSPVTALIPPIQVSLVTDNFGEPSTTVLASVTLQSTYVYSSSFWVVAPLSTSVTANTAYWVVTNQVGNSGHYYAWQRALDSAGASVSSDGVTWTSQPYSMMYQVFEQGNSNNGSPTLINEDSGARITTLTYDPVTDALTGLSTVTLNATGNANSYSATMSYTNGRLTSIG